MKTVARMLPALLVAACALRTRVDAPACANDGECRSGEVCFLGECRGASAALTAVSVEVRPPADSPLGTLQRAGLDLHGSVIQDLALQPSFDVSGSVREDLADGGTAALDGATVVFAPDSTPIPDRVTTVAVQTGTTGAFAAQRLTAGSWTASVYPAALPPQRGVWAVSSPQSGITLRVPPSESFRPVAGVVTLNAAPLGGAQVSAVDATGAALSAPATTAADGTFILLVAQAAASFQVQVGPQPSAPASDLPTWNAVTPTIAADGSLTVALAAPASAKLSGIVTDGSLPPVPIAGSRVYAIQADPASPWTLLRSTTAAADGSWSLDVRQGSWSVQAVPSADPSAPAISEPVTVTIGGDTRMTIICPPKARGIGYVLSPTGRPVGSGYQITATRLPDRIALTGRTATTTPTDATGAFRITGDGGLYRVEVAPPLSSALPRRIVQLQLDSANDQVVTLPAIQLAAPVEVVGKVHGAPAGGVDAPVAGATVNFFALDAEQHSVLIGTNVTAADGTYRTVLPDVPLPSVAP